jgi:hypothetical protein
VFSSALVRLTNLEVCDSYGLVSEHRKGAYKYFSNMGRTIEEAAPRTVYVDEVRS